MKRLKISVTDFAQKNQMVGDIDETASVAQVSTELGMEIHREIQDRRMQEFADYQREIALEGRLQETDGVSIHISGRMDGLWTEGEMTVIEEIKSSMNVRKLLRAIEDEREHPYVLQVKLYGWLFWKQRGIIPRLQLLIVAAGSREEQVMPIHFDPYKFTDWVEQRQAWLAECWKQILGFKVLRKRMAKALRFPLEEKRDAQLELMQAVATACKDKSQLIIQAPTGLGKTAGVMFPLLKAVLRRGDKLFYVTPKNSQLREAEKFLLSLAGPGPKPLSLIMTAKPKICVNSEVVCTPEACKFAKRHYDKVNANALIEKLRDEVIISRSRLQDLGREYEVCPYELSQQIMPWVDVIVGDYHYALAPRATLREKAKLPLVQDPKPALAIDEAHNLVERALDWYSHSVDLIPEDVLTLASKKIRRVMTSINNEMTSCLSTVPPNTVIRKIDRKKFIDLIKSWTSEMPLILEKSNDDDRFKPLILHWFSWLKMAELCQLSEEMFFVTKSQSGQSLMMHCANTGILMRETMDKFNVVVAFSATMKPFFYHQSMMGFTDERVVSKEYASPFPARNRRIIAIPQVSTAWRDRPKSLPRIIDVLERVIALKAGNYAAFFPSFELMRQVSCSIKAEGFELIEQPTTASGTWVQDVVERLSRSRNILLMAVQGGLLSEGIDLPGDQLIGAFIVGPAVSAITPEREERRRLLALAGSDGFAMTYGYPAIAKSIQSAGRVIRSATDRGIIILLDPRFLTPPYSEGLPSDWVCSKKGTKSLISSSILSDIKSFWSIA